ncbi:MAG: SMP-30/gluconolactonase/LRE family protein [Bacteroidetes bacterium]|nr:SMP-30/gluconolactonase/LRE family protein [Bacteroidota bacterium]
MKKILLLSCLLLALMAGFFLYTFYSTGYFREIVDGSEAGEVYTTFALPGVEDIALAKEDSLLLLSVDDRAARREGKEGMHGIYLVDLREDSLQAISISSHLNFPFYPHGISVFYLDSARYGLMAINHVEGKHSIESFILQGKSLEHVGTLTGKALISPNDLVMVSPEAFYFSNDHGYTSSLGLLAENYLGLSVANVGYYDGKSFRSVADNLSFPNGLQVDPSKKLLYVASSRGFMVRVFDVLPDGNLAFVEDIPTGTGVDNIELDPQGKLWIGCHPNLLTFASYAGGNAALSPSEVITIDYQKGKKPEVRSVWTNSGAQLSSASVAVPFDKYLFVGNVMDSKVLVLKKE